MDIQKEFDRIRTEVKEEVKAEIVEQQAKEQAEQDRINNDPFQQKLNKYK